MLQSRGTNDIISAVSKESKTEAEMKTIADWLRTVKFFKNMQKGQLMAVWEKVRLEKFARGETVIK